MLLIDEAVISPKKLLIESVKRSSVEVGDSLRLRFLFELSRKLMRSKKAKAYPDLITFAYFCRDRNITSILKSYPYLKKKIGWGILVHIAPSNVPINFAFSFLFGFVSGNSNIVRLPSKPWPQVELLLEFISEILFKHEYTILRDKVLFIRTSHDSQWLNEAVSHCDGLLVWGGDETVANFRSLKKLPRCVEMYFPNRVSSLIMNAAAYIEASQNDKSRISEDFYNDTYVVDQNACSSPTRILWVGSAEVIKVAKDEFWGKVKDVIGLRSYTLDPISRIDRYLDVMACLRRSSSKSFIQQLAPDLWVQDNVGYSSHITRFGNFIQSSHVDLDTALRNLRVGEQTLTYFGFSSELLSLRIKDLGNSIDRVVPIGQALGMNFIWDGVNLLDRFSRHIEVI